MKYKVGDKVRIKSIDWYNDNKNNRNEITFEDNPHWRFVANQSDYCGQIATITSVSKTAYRLEHIPWNWTDEMIEGLVDEETTSDKVIEEAKTYWDSIKDAWICPEGYTFKDENGNVINATKIVLEKKKKEYPKTYEECLKIMGVKLSDCYIQGYKSPLLEDLQELLICRDAYWKIAGEEMGLGKPWEPDWEVETSKYIILCKGGEIQRHITCKHSRVLAFPTEEMRDAFKENFKKEIESCKELL